MKGKTMIEYKAQTNSFITKKRYIVWLNKVGRNVYNYDEAKKLYDKWVSLNYENVRLEIIEEAA
jgi:hypothetical protein